MTHVNKCNNKELLLICLSLTCRSVLTPIRVDPSLSGKAHHRCHLNRSHAALSAEIVEFDNKAYGFETLKQN